MKKSEQKARRFEGHPKCECGGAVPLRVGRYECPNGCGRSFHVTEDAFVPGWFKIICFGKRSVPIEHQPVAVGALVRGGR